MVNLWTPRCLLFSFWACAELPTLIHGRLIKQTMKFTWEVGAPNGNARKMIKINGKFPGPSIIADEGDIIEVKVDNQLPFNTTIHWHGIEQRGSPWSDGVPGLSQRPIEPGETYIYKWQANTYGTYWYHAHSRTTLQDGLYGAIFIRPKKDEPTPFHLISKNKKDIKAMTRAALNPNLVLVSDWTNFTSAEYMKVTRESGMTIFCTDSILTNGKGDVFCPPQQLINDLLYPIYKIAFEGVPPTDKGCFPPILSVQGPYPFNESLVPLGLQTGCVESKGSREVFHVDPEQEWVSFNFIAATAIKTLKISIDEHPMWIYEVDGRWIEPQLADAMIMFNGERYSAMVKLNKKPGSYTMRIGGSGLDQVISGLATMTYRNSPRGGLGRESRPSIDYGGQKLSKSVRELDVNKLTPFNHVPPAKQADALYFLNVGRLGSAWEWSMDGKKLYAPDRSAYNPLIYNLSSVDAQDPDLIIRTKNGSWVDIVFQVGTNPTQPVQFPHSIHKHSNKMYKIGKGLGFFNWTSMPEAIAAKPELFNLENPPYRDTFMTTDEGPMWIAIRYHVIVPGPFLLHCHIETHLEGGMAVVLLDGVDKWPEVPEPYRRQGQVGPATTSTYK